MRAMDIHAVTDILALAFILFAFAACLNGALRLLERRMRHGG